jgi:hypothetical protein
MNTNCTIYREISKIAAVQRSSEPPRFGGTYFRRISDGRGSGLPFGTEYTLAIRPLAVGRRDARREEPPRHVAESRAYARPLG